MRRPWFAVLLCVFLVQRAASQASCQCQSDLFISMDDLLRSINSGQLNLNQGNIGQNSCGCQNSLNQLPFSSQPISYGNQLSGFQTNFQPTQQIGCGCQQPSFANQPSLSLGNQNFGCQASSLLSQLSGCNQQPSISIGNQPSLSLGNQIYGSPSLLRNQLSCGCGSQQLSNSLPNQPSLSLSNLLGYQPSFSQNQQSCVSIGSQSSLSLPSQQTSCNQQSLTTRPSLSLQSGSCNQQYATPTISFNNVPQQSCAQSQSQQSCNQCSSQSQSANIGSNIDLANIFNIGNNVVSVVPNALLQAPPFGIFFEGENLLIDGAVQVCGSMPFNSAVQLAGMMPASGVGNVRYTCNDVCES